MSKLIDRTGKIVAIGFTILACIFNPDATPLLFCFFLFCAVLILLYTTDLNANKYGGAEE